MKTIILIGAAALLTTTTANAAPNSPDTGRAENVIKMIIGLNHMRCAEITYVQKLQGSVYGVTCIKIAGRPARVHYAIDAANNAVVGVR